MTTAAVRPGTASRRCLPTSALDRSPTVSAACVAQARPARKGCLRTWDTPETKIPGKFLALAIDNGRNPDETQLCRENTRVDAWQDQTKEYIMFTGTFRWVALILVAAASTAAAADDEPAGNPANPVVGKIRLLILSGANNHDWKSTTPVLKKMYEQSGRFTVAVTEDVPSLKGADFARFDALVCNYTTFPNVAGHRWPAETEKAFLDYIAAGHGLVLFHAASTAWNDWPEFGDLIGMTWQKGISAHGDYHSFAVTIVDHEHPVTRGMQGLPARQGRALSSPVEARDGPRAGHRLLRQGRCAAPATTSR